MIKCIFVFLCLFLPILSIGQDVKDSVNSTQSAKDQEFEKEIFVEVDEVPDFPGGAYAMILFLHQNVNYPLDAKKNSIDGTVYVEFVIEKDGTLSEIKARNDIGGGCGAEAVRVVSIMPKWIPGKVKGTTVPTRFVIPIKFVLK